MKWKQYKSLSPELKVWSWVNAMVSLLQAGSWLLLFGACADFLRVLYYNTMEWLWMRKNVKR